MARHPGNFSNNEPLVSSDPSCTYIIYNVLFQIAPLQRFYLKTWYTSKPQKTLENHNSPKTQPATVPTKTCHFPRYVALCLQLFARLVARFGTKSSHEKQHIRNLSGSWHLRFTSTKFIAPTSQHTFPRIYYIPQKLSKTILHQTIPTLVKPFSHFGADLCVVYHTAPFQHASNFLG